MEALIAAVAGYLLGSAAQSTTRSTLSSLGITLVAWVLALLAMAVFADVVQGAKNQPAWVGFASLCFAVAFFFGSRKK